MSKLAQAKQQEAAAIAELLALGQQMRRLLETIGSHEHVPAEIKSMAKDLARQHVSASRDYAEASAARAIARQVPIPAGSSCSTRRKRCSS